MQVKLSDNHTANFEEDGCLVIDFWRDRKRSCLVLDRAEQIALLKLLKDELEEPSDPWEYHNEL